MIPNDSPVVYKTELNETEQLEGIPKISGGNPKANTPFWGVVFFD